MRQSCARIGLTALIALVAAPLAACNEVTSRAGCEAFPALVTYSREQQTQAAVELAALPPQSPLRPMIEELGAYRARRRAICA